MVKAWVGSLPVQITMDSGAARTGGLDSFLAKLRRSEKTRSACKGRLQGVNQRTCVGIIENQRMITDKIQRLDIAFEGECVETGQPDVRRYARNVEVSELPHIGEGLIMGALDLASVGFQLRTEMIGSG